MELKDYLPLRGLEYTKDRIRERAIPYFEGQLGITFGEQLKYYLLTFGRLEYRNVQFYGIMKSVGPASDMIAVTRAIRSRYRGLEHLVAIEEQNKGDYYLIDANDRIWRFVAAYKELTDTGMELNDYIISRMY